MKPEARRWFVSGRVQGVGFRYFVEKNAAALGLTGWARNEDDGSVQVYAVGPKGQLNKLAGLLHLGPPLSSVRAVAESEAEIQAFDGFHTR